jgi:hypothetical protein
MRSTPRRFALLALALAAAGCAPYATFPPIEVTGGLTSPTTEPFPALMIESIRHTAGAQASDYAWNLPPGSNKRLYDEVTRRLAAGHPMRSDGERAYHVTVVRVRGVKGEVDVIVPKADGTNELVTVYFENHLGRGWHVVGDRAWALHVEPPAPTLPEAERLYAGEKGHAAAQP